MFPAFQFIDEDYHRFDGMNYDAIASQMQGISQRLTEFFRQPLNQNYPVSSISDDYYLHEPDNMGWWNCYLIRFRIGRTVRTVLSSNNGNRVGIFSMRRDAACPPVIREQYNAREAILQVFEEIYATDYTEMERFVAAYNRRRRGRIAASFPVA